jgi:hypothetical protein
VNLLDIVVVRDRLDGVHNLDAGQLTHGIPRFVHIRIDTSSKSLVHPEPADSELAATNPNALLMLKKNNTNFDHTFFGCNRCQVRSNTRKQQFNRLQIEEFYGFIGPAIAGRVRLLASGIYNASYRER